jgi:acetylornithine deacetylase
VTAARTSESLVARLAELVAFDTRNPGGSERPLVDCLAAHLSGASPTELVVRDVPRAGNPAPGAYVFARWGTPRVIVNAHVDTVATGPGWSADPFSMRVGGGRATGLGTADTKGAIAAALAALDLGTPRDSAVLFSGDEEQGGACIEAFLASEHAKDIEVAIVCEPTGCRVGHRHRGILALEIDAQGEGGHSSRADAMPAPIVELARVAAAIGAWGERKRTEGTPGFVGMCTNVAELRGGIAFNIVPPRATLVVSVRPPPGTSVASVEAELEALALAASPGVVTRCKIRNPPLQTRDLAAVRRVFAPACDPPIDLAFWTEAALWQRDGIDAVVFGPGAIDQAHAADEWVALSDLERARDAFAALFAVDKTHVANP